MACMVYGCVNSTYPEDATIQYFSFPQDPAMFQQWVVAAGWQPENIDVATAKICSLHFTEDCYTTEIKMIDFMTCYSKVLKCDAVPTQYLPHILIKQDVEGESTELLPGMIVFTVPPNEKNFIEVEIQTENVLTKEDLEKCSKIQTAEQLRDLEMANGRLEAGIAEMETTLAGLMKSIRNEAAAYKAKDLQLSNLRREQARIGQTSMSLLEQKELLSKVFSEAQIKILSGKKKIYWSNDDMAVGYTIRHLSNRRCYLYLTKKLNIPLPGVSSIKRWMTIRDTTKKSITKKKKRGFKPFLHVEKESDDE